MKTICIYHRIDLDGWMSAAIVKHWFIKNNKRYYIKNLDTTGTEGTIPEGEEELYFLGWTHGDSIPDLSSYDKVIMCDLSFPDDIMFTIYMQKENFIWIDHHISAIKTSLERDYEDTPGLRDTEFSACELTWKYFFFNEPMPEIIRLLGRYDCFGHKGTNEEQKVLEFQYGARQCISDYEEAYKYLLKSLGIIEFISALNIEDIIYNKGVSIYKYLCTEARQTYNNGFVIKFLVDAIPTDEEIRPIPAIGACDICGKEENTQLIRYYFRYENDKCNCHSPYHFDIFDCCQECKPVAKNKVPKKFICINKERFNPINFGIDYHKYGYDGAACFWYSNREWNFSLYNDNGEVDCSEIAKQYGGGGHKGAAGFRIKDLKEIL